MRLVAAFVMAVAVLVMFCVVVAAGTVAIGPALGLSLGAIITVVCVHAGIVYRSQAASLLPPIQPPLCGCCGTPVQFRHSLRYRVFRFLTVPTAGAWVLVSFPFGRYHRNLLSEVCVRIGNYVYVGWLNFDEGCAMVDSIADTLKLPPRGQR